MLHDNTVPAVAYMLTEAEAVLLQDVANLGASVAAAALGAHDAVSLESVERCAARIASNPQLWNKLTQKMANTLLAACPHLTVRERNAEF